MKVLPAHYSSLEEVCVLEGQPLLRVCWSAMPLVPPPAPTPQGLKLAASSSHSHSYSTPNSPAATPTHKPKEKGSPLAHNRSLTTPTVEQTLPPLQLRRSARRCHTISFKESAPSSLPGSPVHSRKLPGRMLKPKPPEPNAEARSTADMFGLSPRQPRRIVAPKNSLKMAVVSPNLRSADKVLSLNATPTPPSDDPRPTQYSAEQ